MNPGPAVPARLVLSAGQPPPSADSLRNRQPPCLPFGPREVSTSENKSQSQPLAAGPTASAPFPGAAVKFLRGICVPARCPRPGPPPGPRAARPRSACHQGPRPSRPDPLASGPPLRSLPAAATDGLPASPAKDAPRPLPPPQPTGTSARAPPPPPEVPGAGAAGTAPPLPGWPAGVPSGATRGQRGVSVGSEGQARCGSAGSSAPRLRGPAGRAQVSRVGRAELGPGPAAGPQSVPAALHPHPCAPPLRGARGGPGARRAARGETRAERSPRGARAGERGPRSG